MSFSTFLNKSESGIYKNFLSITSPVYFTLQFRILNNSYFVYIFLIFSLLILLVRLFTHISVLARWCEKSKNLIMLNNMIGYVDLLVMWLPLIETFFYSLVCGQKKNLTDVSFACLLNEGEINKYVIFIVLLIMTLGHFFFLMSKFFLMNSRCPRNGDSSINSVI